MSLAPTVITNPFPVWSLVCGVPTSGPTSSLYTFIDSVSDLFPASSIACIVIRYSPSVFIFIGMSISSTFVFPTAISFFLKSLTSYSYPFITPIAVSSVLPFPIFCFYFYFSCYSYPAFSIFICFSYFWF